MSFCVRMCVAVEGRGAVGASVLDVVFCLVGGLCDLQVNRLPPPHQPKHRLPRRVARRLCDCREHIDHRLALLGLELLRDTCECLHAPSPVLQDVQRPRVGCCVTQLLLVVQVLLDLSTPAIHQVCCGEEAGVDERGMGHSQCMCVCGSWSYAQSEEAQCRP